MESKAQVRSKKRVTDHGEVFTSAREVSNMLEMVKQETERIDSRFLEPACGNGNFLAAILKRKLEVTIERYGNSQLEFERYSVVAVGSIYGVELLPDNAQECRERLYNGFNELYTSHYGTKCTDQCRRTIRFILSKNILCGDALTLKTPDGSPIVFSEWTLVLGSSFKRRDYTFNELMEANSSGQITIFQAAMDYDEQAGGFIPNPVREFPITHYGRLAEYE